MRFEPFVGLRYLMAKRQRNVLSVITIISITGVAVGVMALIVVLSVMGGFRVISREKIIGAKAHIVVSGKSGYLENHEEIADKIRGVDGVVGASPFLEGEVMVNSVSNLQGVIMRGVDPDTVTNVTDLEEDMEHGGLEYLDNPDDLPAGVGLDSGSPFDLMLAPGAYLQSDGIDGEPEGSQAGEMDRANARHSLRFLAIDHAEFVEEIDRTPVSPDSSPLDTGSEDTGSEDAGSDDGSSQSGHGGPSPAGDSPAETDPSAVDENQKEGNPKEGIQGESSEDTDAGGAIPDVDDVAPDVEPSRQMGGIPGGRTMGSIPGGDGSKPGDDGDNEDVGTDDQDDNGTDDGDDSIVEDSEEEDVWLSDAPEEDVWVNGGSEDDAGEEDGDARPSTGSLGPSRGRRMGPIPGTATEKKVGGLIIGKELQDTLAVYPGSEVNVMSPMGNLGPSGSLPKSRPFKVVGIFYSGMYEFDTKYVYMTLDEAQRFLNVGEMVTGIEVKIEDMDKSGEVKERIEEVLGDDYEGVQVKDWRELNTNLFSALMLEKIAMFVILGFIILVASFSIVCLLIMIVIEKGREIAILKSMGASNGSIVGIFVLLGGVIGVIGTAIGAAVGLGLCWVIAGWGIELPADVYYLSHVPVEVRPMEVLLICGAAIGISLLATILPSVLAALLDPVEGLRYD